MPKVLSIGRGRLKDGGMGQGQFLKKPRKPILKKPRKPVRKDLPKKQRTRNLRTRLLNEETVPERREQTPPYRRSPQIYGQDRQIHWLGAFDDVKLEYGQGDLRKWGATTRLDRVEIKTSLLADAGNGMFASDD